VRNSDYLKNKTDCKLVAFFSENCYEDMMKIFFEHCYKKSYKYWIHWGCRMFLLYKLCKKLFNKKNVNKTPVSSVFLVEDKQIKKYIELNNPELNPQTEEEIAHINNFDDVFRSFISFIQNFDDIYWNKLNPTQMFALFYVFCDDTKDKNILLSHIPYLSREGQSSSKRNLWESRADKEQRRLYFERCLKQISSINEIAMPVDERQISKSLKKQVWRKCTDNKCEICEDEIKESEFEVGHIRARVFGGQTNIDNLIPICFACNRGMGTKNAYDYKTEMYPEL
jgi:hypothetical protein